MAAAKRGNPAAGPVAKAGNYSAPIDTSGIDPEMQKTLGGTGYVPPEPPLSGLLRRIFGKKSPQAPTRKP